MPSSQTITPALCAAGALLFCGLAAAQQFQALRKDHGQGAVSPLTNNAIAKDFDGNGTIDLLLRSGSVLIHDGQLGFTWDPPGSRVPLAANQVFPQLFREAADVNGDGLLDLVVGGISFQPPEAHISVLFGTASGFWSTAQLANSTPGFDTMRLLVDVDADGFPDIFSGSNGTVVLLRNAGNGTFVDVSATHLPANTTGTPTAFADVDGDGDQDVLSMANGLPLEILINDGAGHFSVLANPGLLAYFIAPAVSFGDADADGDPDILVTPSNGAATELFLNSGQGTFTNSGWTLPNTRYGRTFADIDLDGDADLLVVDYGPAKLVPWRNVGGGQFVSLQALETESLLGLGEPILADLDGDTDLDIVFGGNLIYLDDGNQNYSQLQRNATPWHQQGGSVVAGDLNGDDSIDLLLGNETMINDGTGFFTRAFQTLPQEGAARAMFDADNDGDLDVVWTTRDNSLTGVTDGGLMLNQGGMLVFSAFYTNSLLLGDVVAADFDGDGLIDLCSEAGIVLQNIGGGNFTAAAGPVLGNGKLAAADFDGDGLIDIAMGNALGWEVWSNLGNMQFQQTSTLLMPTPSCLTTGDIDDDGDIDVVAGAFSSSFGGQHGYLQTWTNHQGVFTAGTVYIDGSTPPPAVVLADVDEDGALDLVSDRVRINDGTGIFVDDMRGANGLGELAVADLDRDGDPEVIFGGEFVSTVFVNRHRHIGTPRFAVLDHPYQIDMAVQPGYGGGNHLVVPALASTRLTPAVATPFGLLHLDPTIAAFGAIGITDANGEYSLPIMVPNTPALAGADLFWQGITVDTTSLRLTGLAFDTVIR